MKKTKKTSLEELYDDLQKAKKEYSSVGERMRKDLADLQNRIAEIKDEMSKVSNTTKKLYLMEHPVGSIVMNTSGINPGITYGGKWEAYAPGRTLMGVKKEDERFQESNLTGGKEEEVHIHVGFAHTHFRTKHNHRIPMHKHKLPYLHAHPQSHYHTLNSHIHLCTHDHIWIHYHIQNFGWNGEYYTYINIPIEGHSVEEAISSEYAELSNASAVSTERSIRNRTSGAYTSTTGEEKHTVFSNTETSGTAEHNFTDENIEPTSYTDSGVGLSREMNSSDSYIYLGESEDLVDEASYHKMQPYITCYYFRRIE